MSAAPDAPDREPDRPPRPQARRRPPPWLRVGVSVLLALLVAVTFGVTTASAELSLGPHEAHYEVTTDSLVTVDVGPLGTIEIPSPLPLTLGARVRVQEIPSSVTAVDASATLNALGGDVQSYVQFFAGPQATLRQVVHALAVDAAWRSLGAFAVILGVGLGLRALLGPSRRRELADAVAPHSHQLIAAGTVGVVLLTVCTASLGEQDRRAPAQAASPVFDGTPLEGARVTGRLAGVIDTYGTYLLDAYRENTEFYSAADEALVAAWEKRAAAMGPRPEARTSPTPSSTSDGDDGDDADGAGGRAEAAEPVVLLVVSDLHCNVGMAPLIRSAVEQSGASVVLDAGDTTINGTAVEEYCLTTLTEAVPDSAQIVVAPGNHDSAETSAMYRRAGATVLDGEIVEVQGVRILGDSDVNQTRIGEGTSRAGTESAAEQAERLADTACYADDPVDLLLTHTPSAGDDALERGCVPAEVSGHLHRRIGPLRIGEGVRYVNASTAGAVANEPTVGPLRGTAEMTVLRFDPETRRITDYQLVQVRTDRSASVGPWIPWPARIPVPVRVPPGVA